MSEILKSKDVITRKPHDCFGCNKTYSPSTSMKRQSVKDGNTVFTSYLCETCQEVIARTFEYGDEFGEGDVRNGDPEYWEDMSRELQSKEATK